MLSPVLSTCHPVFLWVSTFMLYWSMYPALHFLLSKHERYTTQNRDRQQYIISNLLKATVLCLGTILLFDVILDLVVEQKWNGQTLQLVAPFYANLDVVSLFQVKEMMRSTLVHHVLVGLFGLVVALSNVDEGTVAGHICVYALFSMVAYFVNGFLALRFLINDLNRPFLNRMAHMCGTGYLAVCVVHWTFHAYYIWLHFAALWYLPLFFVAFVYDDLYLMNWLFSY